MQLTYLRLVHFVTTMIPLFNAGLITVAVVILGIILSRLHRNQILVNRKWVLIEATPSISTQKSAEATMELFSFLHGRNLTPRWWQRLGRPGSVMSYEIVSTKADGIKYLIRVRLEDASMLERTLAAYLSDVKYRRVGDYLTDRMQAQTPKILQFRQTGHFGYPLKSPVNLNQHDLGTYLTGMMTQLESEEIVALQLVVSPVRVHEAESLGKRMLSNEAIISSLGSSKKPVTSKIIHIVNEGLFAVTDTISLLTAGARGVKQSNQNSEARRKQDVAMKIRPARSLGALEQELAREVHDKLTQPLFRVDIRLLIVMGSKQKRLARVREARHTLAGYNRPPYQGLTIYGSVMAAIMRRYSYQIVRYRLPSILRRHASLLSSRELASMYHFPNIDGQRVENVIQSLSRTLPAPVSLKGNERLDVVIGINRHHGSSTPIGLTAQERQRHVYVIGGTGNGKTTMLEYGLVQDIASGKGVAVIDPHGDLAEKLLGYVPEERIKDVIYFNPSDLGYPIGLNILELPVGLVGDDLMDAKDFITETVISIMRKVFSDDDSGGHRIEYILRNTVQTALTIPDATLFTVFDLLTDGKFLKQTIRTLVDTKLRNFWINEFGKAGDYARVKMAAGVTAKIGRFQFSASAERILSQPKSTINFDEILDGKILICNFAKGLIGEDTSELFGITILAMIQLAAYRRVKQHRAARVPFYLYVDEFQNFATMSFVQMLSEARKYQVFLTMAEQSTSQQKDRNMVNIILANVGTVISFRTGNPADEEKLLPLFVPYISAGEIANLPTFQFYARLAGVLSQQPLSGETIVLTSPPNLDITERVIASSRKLYGHKRIIREEPFTSKSRALSPKDIEHISHEPIPGDQRGRIPAGRDGHSA